MKIRLIVAATSAALFSLGAMAAGDDKQKQSQGQDMQKSQSAQTSKDASSSTSAQSSDKSAGVGASAQSGAQAQSSDIVKQVQQKLSQEGHQLQADGIMGPKTQAALKEYQEKKGLEASGQLNRETLSALGVSGSAGSSAATGGSGTGQSQGQPPKTR